MKKFVVHPLLFLLNMFLVLHAVAQSGKQTFSKPHAALSCCMSGTAKRFEKPAYAFDTIAAAHSKSGMVWIEGGTYDMGADNDQGLEDEYPKHNVTVHGFWMDATEVTNAQFAAFVKATGYITTAERKPDWKELKKSLPMETPKPPDSLLVAASLVFQTPMQTISLNDYGSWWKWQPGA